MIWVEECLLKAGTEQGNMGQGVVFILKSKAYAPYQHFRTDLAPPR
jgi:hypothetical protein